MTPADLAAFIRRDHRAAVALADVLAENLVEAVARAEKAEATIAEAWATMPPERVRLLHRMGVTLAEVVTDAQEWREHERARADAAEAVVAAARDAIDGACASSDYAAVRRALGVSL